MNLNLNHLYYFYVVAREGSISKAAKKLFVTQPTVSFQLRVFEEFLGYQLFERLGGKLLITDSGRRLKEKAEKIFLISSEILNTLKPEPPAFSVGYSFNTPADDVFALCSQLRASHQQSAFKFVLGSDEYLAGLFAQGVLGAYVTYIQPAVAGAKCVHFADYDVAVVINQRSDFRTNKRLDLLEFLRGQEYVEFCAGPKTKGFIDQLGVSSLLSSDDIHLVKRMMAEVPRAFTLIPRSFLGAVVPDLLCVGAISDVTETAYFCYAQGLASKFPTLLRLLETRE